MVREIYKISKSRSFNIRKIFEGRHGHTHHHVVLENNGHGKDMKFKSQLGAKSSSTLELQQLSSIFNKSVDHVTRFAKEGERSRNIHKDKQSSGLYLSARIMYTYEKKLKKFYDHIHPEFTISRFASACLNYNKLTSYFVPFDMSSFFLIESK